VKRSNHLKNRRLREPKTPGRLSEFLESEDVEPPRNAAGYESQELRGKETVRGRKRGGHGGPPVQGFSLLAGGASSAVTDSAEFLESER